MAISPVAADVLAAPGEPEQAPPGQPWPRPAQAWWAVGVLALALMFAQLDRSIFSMMIEMVKKDFGLTDVQMGMLLGPASIMFYVVVGIPMARLVDNYPRNVVLSAGIMVWSGITALTGFIQSYAQLFLCRMLVGIGGSAHGPGTYSMLADYFPPKRLPRAIAGLQVGFVAGVGLASILGGTLVTMVSHWPATHWGPITIRNWQWVLIMVGTPGLLVAWLVWRLHEPARRGLAAEGAKMSFGQVLREIGTRRGVYLPLFLGLALSSIEAGGLQEWRVPFMQRTFGWTPQQVGMWAGTMAFICMPIGILFGTWLTEWLSRRHRDAPVRATAIVFGLSVPFAIASPLMPTGELAIVMASIGTIFAMASSVPQNAAIQTVTPNEMRGQVTAIYLFMFTVFQALGSLFVALVTSYIVGDEQKLWLSMALTAAVMMPLATVAIALAMRPYGREMERREKAGLV